MAVAVELGRSYLVRKISPAVDEKYRGKESALRFNNRTSPTRFVWQRLFFSSEVTPPYVVCPPPLFVIRGIFGSTTIMDIFYSSSPSPSLLRQAQCSLTYVCIRCYCVHTAGTVVLNFLGLPPALWHHHPRTSSNPPHTTVPTLYNKHYSFALILSRPIGWEPLR